MERDLRNIGVIVDLFAALHGAEIVINYILICLALAATLARRENLSRSQGSGPHSRVGLCLLSSRGRILGPVADVLGTIVMFNQNSL
jgi:hypothetical protein